MKYDEETVEKRVREMCENPFWRDMYENAPAGAKRRLRIAFWAAKGLDEKEYLDEYREDRTRTEREMTYEDFAYLAERFPEGKGKSHYVEMRNKAQLRPLKTRDKLDAAVERMTADWSREDREAVERTRQSLLANDDPFVEYELLWEAVGGNAESCDMLGDVFDHGHGTERDEGLAYFWFRRGAMCGSAECCCRLAQMMEYEDSELFDFEAVNFWFREALRRDGKSVRWMLGHRLTTKEGIWERHRNPALGVELLKRGLDGDTKGFAHFYLGRCYERGVGVERDLKEAVLMTQMANDRDEYYFKDDLKRLKELLAREHSERGDGE